MNEYKYYVSDTKECRSNGCPDGYFQFNFECYKDDCPPDSYREFIFFYKCRCNINYFYINEHFQTAFNFSKKEEYKYNLYGTYQYLKSCSESLIYTTAGVESYLYNGICYLSCPNQTEANPTEGKCTCKYYTYYTDSTKNKYTCYEESVIC